MRAVTQDIQHQLTVLAQRCDKGCHNMDALAAEQGGDLRRPSDVLRALIVTKTQVGAQAAPQIITVQNDRDFAFRTPVSGDPHGECGFARSRQTIKPDDATAVFSHGLILQHLQ